MYLYCIHCILLYFSLFYLNFFGFFFLDFFWIFFGFFFWARAAAQNGGFREEQLLNFTICINGVGLRGK